MARQFTANTRWLGLSAAALAIGMLSACASVDASANTVVHADTNSDANPHADANPHSDANPHADSDTHTDPNPHANSDPDQFTNAEPHPNPGCGKQLPNGGIYPLLRAFVPRRHFRLANRGQRAGHHHRLCR